jgi:hypothetical protein
MYPSKRNQVMVVLEIKNLLLVHCRARVGRAVLFRHQQMRNLQLVFVLKNTQISQLDSKIENGNCTKLPARIPHVSTLFSLLLWARSIKRGSSCDGISTRRSPSWLCSDGLSRDIGFVERSTFGRGITELQS